MKCMLTVFWLEYISELDIWEIEGKECTQLVFKEKSFSFSFLCGQETWDKNNQNKVLRYGEFIRIRALTNSEQMRSIDR